ncbi:fused MFS/spermidine synthase [Accumulibacter sp.]|uniref:fused MFS/spermidine synthase n=1 Tax=Accumulibacter sp. TaxID=2053492 RepID=UPI0025FB5050|nr:fused MFS/spermidine synthase [Accumulibacter sp.]MCM8611604.1 fused MFS/spermidine synthase [Accumulibacter sp.]MCM8635636.1 fused MFS/spermidine synthase [Accumulibacter sp.]MCM8639301.1 fused MFS/spermidine synthase [Accumulibacter sp.]
MISFALTVFLSAFLLFQIQPIIAKMILPWFGGSSSVWSTCMVFFQAALLLGYLYVHLLHEWLSPRRQVMVHGVLLLLSLATLPVIANPAWKDVAFASPTWNALVVLAATVGMPYLLLSTTGPLMQAWYARSFNSMMPYRLYALSNLASMLALLSYPVLVEPFFVVVQQAHAWSVGYVFFVVACLASAWQSWQGVSGELERSPASSESVPRPPLRECLLWIGLAMTASILLLALTRHLTQDVAPVPFLWVLPLSIYLLSFILCFDAPRYYHRRGFLIALPIAFVALDQVLAEGGMPVPLLVSVLCLALFVFCMVCHGELVRRRPPVRHLTLFYLMLSIGGAIGGSFVGLLAPALFNAYFELPIGLFLCAVLVIIVLWPQVKPVWRWLLLAALAVYGYRLAGISVDYVEDYRRVMRNFYGQLRVADVSDDDLGIKRRMFHGRINHGEQFIAPEHSRRPTAYYCEQSGIGQALLSLPTERPRRIGVVGLGAGTLATYGRPGDEMRLYEIDDQVLELARSDFSYLAESRARIVPVLGDGRLMLESEAPQAFDLLAIDAFSGDSIPAHLLTLEAMQSYLRHMRSDGILAVHITNRYLDLQPVVAAAAAKLGMSVLVVDLDPADGEVFCRRSLWALLVRPERAASLQAASAGARPLQPRAGFTAWTDGFSNLLGILK